MSLELVIGSAIGASTLGLYVRWFSRLAQRKRTRTHHALTLRRVLDQLKIENPYRVVVERDLPPEVVSYLERAKSLETELSAAGFTLLPHIITMFDRDLVARAFVDANGTHSVLVAITGNTAMVQLTSFGTEETYITRRGPSASPASPPSLHRQALASSATFAEMFASHRSFVPAELAVASISSCERLVAEFVKSRQRTIAWRSTQPADDLLEADLRGLLGDDYLRSGAWFTRRFRASLPQAILRRG